MVFYSQKLLLSISCESVDYVFISNFDIFQAENTIYIFIYWKIYLAFLD